MDKAKCRLQMRNPCHLLATCFGSGLSSIMPGTIGSLVAIPIWLLLIQLPWQLYLLLLIFSIYLGIYLCHQTEKDIQSHDHSSIVWDEFVGMLITLTMLPVHNWKWLIISLVIFRILDIVKPWPISWLDLHVKGGIGIMIDDIIAGLLSVGVIYLIHQYQLISTL